VGVRRLLLDLERRVGLVRNSKNKDTVQKSDQEVSEPLRLFEGRSAIGKTGFSDAQHRLSTQQIG
jgi:hypothetical protein